MSDKEDLLSRAKELARPTASSVPVPKAVITVTPGKAETYATSCLLYTSPSPRDGLLSRMPSSA